MNRICWPQRKTQGNEVNGYHPVFAKSTAIATVHMMPHAVWELKLSWSVVKEHRKCEHRNLIQTQNTQGMRACSKSCICTGLLKPI